MNKKVMMVLIIFIIIIAGIGAFILFNNKNNNESITENNTEEKGDTVNNNEQGEQDKNISSENSVVVYFSATGNTKKIAKYISEITNSKMIEIMPKEEYTSNDLNYGNDNSRANKEQNDSSARPEMKNSIDVSNYDTIYLGFPIWWGDTPKIILTFMESTDLKGKTIIPFCTSGSTGISQSMNTLKSYFGIKFIDGRRFSSSSQKSEIESWIKEIN